MLGAYSLACYKARPDPLTPRGSAITRLIGAMMFEQNDEWWRIQGNITDPFDEIERRGR